MAKVWSGLEGPVLPLVVVPGNGEGIVRVVEKSQPIASCIVQVTEGEVGRNMHLTNQAWALAEKAAEKLADLSRHR